VSSVPVRVRRWALVAVAILVFIMLVGATYQGVATALERRQYPRPGGMVSVGDHQLHIYCDGSGSPTVILEAPAAGVSAAWGDVQARVSRTTRACSYDRAGLGWSESSGRPYDPGRVPEELQALLSGAGEKGPYVIAGHGLGASFARMYAARAGSDVAALVMIDPPSPAPGPLRDDPAARLITISPWLARAGVLRAGRILSSKANALNGAAGGSLRSFLNRPDHLARASREMEPWDLTVRMGASAELPPGVPTTVIEATGQDRVAFLTEPAEIERAVQAIEEAVARVRHGQNK
jgi:pimeloyl-ACP methyl ester carboxylesterase